MMYMTREEAFKDAEECWQEMQKHQPFGWVRLHGDTKFTNYSNVDSNCDFDADFEDFTFADGSVFGVKLEG